MQCGILEGGNQGMRIGLKVTGSQGQVLRFYVRIPKIH